MPIQAKTGSTDSHSKGCSVKLLTPVSQRKKRAHHTAAGTRRLLLGRWLRQAFAILPAASSERGDREARSISWQGWLGESNARDRHLGAWAAT